MTHQDEASRSALSDGDGQSDGSRTNDDDDDDASEEQGEAEEDSEDGPSEPEEGEESGGGEEGATQEAAEAAAAPTTQDAERRRPVAPLFSFPPGPRVRRTEAEENLQVSAFFFLGSGGGFLSIFYRASPPSASKTRKGGDLCADVSEAGV